MFKQISNPAPAAAAPPTERFDALTSESDLITQGLTDLPPGVDPTSILQRRNEVEQDREVAALEVPEDEVTRPNSGVENIFDRTYPEDLAGNHAVDLVRAPIQYLLDDPAKLNALDQANDNDGGSDDYFSLGDIHRRRLELDNVPESAEVPHANGGAYTLPTDDTTSVIGDVAVPERGQAVFDRQQESIEAALRTDGRVAFEHSSGETTRISVVQLESEGAARYEVTLDDGSTLRFETELSLEDSIAGIANVVEWENSLGSQTELDTTVETIRFNKDADDTAAAEYGNPDYGDNSTLTFHGADYIRKTIFDHEIGHYFGEQLDDALVKRFKDSAPAGYADVIAAADADGIDAPTVYADTGPANATAEEIEQEDFAESVAAYVNARDHGEEALETFRQAYPHRTQYIEEHVFPINPQSPVTSNEGPPPGTTIPEDNPTGAQDEERNASTTTTTDPSPPGGTTSTTVPEADTPSTTIPG